MNLKFWACACIPQTKRTTRHHAGGANIVAYRPVAVKNCMSKLVLR